MPDEIALALVTHLVRIGVIDADGIEKMCADLSEDDQHELRCCFVEAVTPEHRPTLSIVVGGKEDD